MYRTLCADFRKLMYHKWFWIIMIVFPVGTAVLFSILDKIIIMIDKAPVYYADANLTAYPALVPFVLATMAGLYLGGEFQEGTLRNKLITGTKRNELFFSTTIIMAFTSVVFQLVATVCVLVSGKLLFDGFMTTTNGILKMTLVHSMASVAISVIFTGVSFMIGNGKWLALCCGVFAIISKFVSVEVCSKLFPETGVCMLSGKKLAIYEWIDKYIPFSYLNGDIRYPMHTYMIGCMACIAVAFVVGLLVYQRKDIK